MMMTWPPIPTCSCRWTRSVSVRLRGKGRKMTHLEAQLHSEEPSSVYAEVKAEGLQLAGVWLDYTDAIAFPST